MAAPCTACSASHTLIVQDCLIRQSFIEKLACTLSLNLGVLLGIPLATMVMERGRWGDVRTARIYLNDGLSRLTQMSLAPHHERFLHHQAQWVKR